jgi:hypothetical protein
MEEFLATWLLIGSVIGIGFVLSDIAQSLRKMAGRK